MDVIPRRTRPERTGALARARLLIGLAQTIALSGVLVADRGGIWSTHSTFFFPVALMASLFLPVVWLSGAGALSSRQMWRWTGAALLIIAGLTAVDILTMDGAPEDPTAFFVQTRLGELVCGTGLLLYGGQVMVLAGARERRWFASRAHYFSCALALGFQLLASLLVAAALGFAALALAAHTSSRPCDAWPFVPACVLGFAGAMHLFGRGASERQTPGS